MENYDTVVSALNGLRSQGFTIDFNVAFDKLICSEKKIILHPEDFEITRIFRFEGDSNPDDEEVVFAIESKDGSRKGVLVSAFGIYSESTSTEMLKKLTIKQ